MDRFSKDGPFEDPVVRCCECQVLITREQIQKFGGCPKCGNKRIRNVLNMTGNEMEALRTKQISEDFLKLFEEASDA